MHSKVSGAYNAQETRALQSGHSVWSLNSELSKFGIFLTCKRCGHCKPHPFQHTIVRAHSFVRSFVRSHVRPFVGSHPHYNSRCTFVPCTHIRWHIQSFVRSFVLNRSFARSSHSSHAHSFVRCAAHSHYNSRCTCCCTCCTF